MIRMPITAQHFTKTLNILDVFINKLQATVTFNTLYVNSYERDVHCQYK